DRELIYRGAGQLLAVVTPAGDRHYHLDHLGSPRLITDQNANKVAFHSYFPYGEEATALGLTLPTAGTDGSSTITSTTPGVMQVHVDSSLSDYAQAPVVAAELAGHVVAGVVGDRAAAPDPIVHHAREDPAIDAA